MIWLWCLVYTHDHTELNIFLIIAKTFKIYFPQLSNIQYSIINYSQHAVHCILNDLCIL